MMNYFYIFLFSTAFIHIQGMQKPHQKPCCPNLPALLYQATSWAGRNDYLYLAHTNSFWYLKMKLSTKDESEDMNRYYLRIGKSFNGMEVPIYMTPLHAAIEKEHFEAIALLCRAGADKNLPIKTSVESTEAAQLCYAGALWFSVFGLSDEEIVSGIKKWKESEGVGLSAYQFSCKLYGAGNEISKFLKK